MLSNAMLKEYPVTQSSVNKVTGMEMFSKVKISQPAGQGFRACYFSSPTSSQVFCSQWLSHKQVIFGTKCNKLMVVDVNTRHMDQIPSLQVDLKYELKYLIEIWHCSPRRTLCLPTRSAASTASRSTPRAHF